MKKAQTTTIIVVTTLALGYFIGAVIGIPVSEGLLSGDINKASRAQKEIITKSNEAFVSKLRNDKAHCEEIKSLLTYITIVAGDYKLNAELTESATASIPEFEVTNAEMIQLKEISNNVYDLSVQTFAAINNPEGKSDEGLEQLYNNTLSSFMLLENSLTFVKNFSVEADTYIAKGNASSDLTFARDLWVDHLMVNAIISDDKMSYKSLAKLETQTSEEEIEKKLLALNDEQKFQIGCSDAIKMNISKTNTNQNSRIFNMPSILQTKALNAKLQAIDMNNLVAAKLVEAGMLGMSRNNTSGEELSAVQNQNLGSIFTIFLQNPGQLGSIMKDEMLGLIMYNIEDPKRLGAAI